MTRTRAKLVRNTRRAASPLKLDPTRTIGLRRQMAGELNRRFALLRGRIVALILKDDALGLSPPQPPTANASWPVPVPVQRQAHDYDCGAAAFVSVARYWGAEPDTEDATIRQLGTSPATGTEPEQIVALATDAGLSVATRTGMSLGDLDVLTRQGIPVICAIQDYGTPAAYARDESGHYVVVTGVDGRDVHCMDPAAGLVSLARDVFEAHWHDVGRSADVRYVRLGIAIWGNTPTRNARQWALSTAAEKVRAFQGWLAQQVQSVGLAARDLWDRYIRAGFQKGAGRSFDDVRGKTKQAGIDLSRSLGTAEGVSDFYRGTKEEFLRTSFARPVAREKVELLVGRTFDEMDGITADMATRMGRVLADGLTEGKSPRQVTKDLTDQVGLGKARALRVARTECLTGDALVDGAMVRAVFRRWYEGDVVEIKTRSGRVLTATPNHPMLTQEGWVAAGALQEGDYLIRHAGQQGASPAHNPDVKRRPAPIGEVFAAVKAIGVFERRATRQPDFHGDGLEGEVDVFAIDRPLTFGRPPTLVQPVVDDVFSPADMSSAYGLPFCPGCRCLLPVDQSVCFVCGTKANARLLETALDRITIRFQLQRNLHDGCACVVHADDLGRIQVGSQLVSNAAMIPGKALGVPVGTADPGLAEDRADPFLVPAFGAGDFSLGHAGQIELDDVVAVRFRQFSGHVYNLETVDGYYTTQGFYTGNCIRAHAEGQLLSLKALGVKTVGVQVEWLVTDDAKLCPECAAMGGSVMDIEDAHGLIPAHPCCRCAWMPAGVGEDEAEQETESEEEDATENALLAFSRFISNWNLDQPPGRIH